MNETLLIFLCVVMFILAFILAFVLIFDWAAFRELRALRRARGSDWTIWHALGLRKDE